MVASKGDKPIKSPKEKMSPAKKKKLYWAGGGLFVFLIIAMAVMPPMGTMRYGICKVYIELNEPYPQAIKLLSAEDGDPVKIYFKKVDPFGVDSVNSIECHFKRDASGQFLNEIAKIDINGKARIYEAEKPAAIQHFNHGIISILDNPPDLRLPNLSLDNIKNYKDNE